MSASIKNIISSKEYPPVLMLFGEEEFLLEQDYTKLNEHLRNGNFSEYDFELLNGEDVDFRRIADSCSAYPFASDKRIVIVNHFEKLTAGRGSKKNTENSPLAKYLRNPQPTTFLIIKTHDNSLFGLQKSLQKDKSGKKIKAAKFPYDIILENHSWIEYPKVWESDMNRWAESSFSKNGKKISPDAAALLVAMTDPSLRAINSEIEKICTHYPDKKELNINDISAVVGTSREHNVFELQKVVGKRDLKAALYMTEKMLADDRQEVLIITILTRYFIALWKLTEIAGNSSNNYQIAGQIGVNPYFVAEYLEALRYYSPADISGAFAELTAADRTVKSSSSDSTYVIQKMLIAIMGYSAKS